MFGTFKENVIHEVLSKEDYNEICKLPVELALRKAYNILSENVPDILLRLGHNTRQHSMRVATMVCIVCAYIGYPREKLNEITLGALLHDIGKIYIPKEILHKKTALTHDEFEIIKTHPMRGLSLLMRTEYCTTEIANIILYHHINYDGTGYPAHSVKIKEHVMLTHTADVYDAMCSERAYKYPIRRDAVRSYMLSQQGTIFSPDVLKIFLKVIPEYIKNERLYNGINTCTVVTTGHSNDTTVNCCGTIITVEEFFNAGRRHK